MKPMRRLTKVELPIAMPVMMAGIRTAMVQLSVQRARINWCRWTRDLIY